MLQILYISPTCNKTGLSNSTKSYCDSNKENIDLRLLQKNTQECLTTTDASKALNRSLVSLSALIMNNHKYTHNSLTPSCYQNKPVSTHVDQNAQTKKPITTVSQ